MRPSWSMTSLAAPLLAVLFARHVTGQIKQCTSNSVGDPCRPDSEDVMAGCAKGDDTGKCTAVGSAFSCIISSARSKETSACSGDGCQCHEGLCIDVNDPGKLCVALVKLCPDGTYTCGDPHMIGLRGQRIDWSGADGAWYALLTDMESDLHVNVRLTAPLADEFPDRQLITGVAILSHDESLSIEVTDPYTTGTRGCPSGVSPCLSNGGLQVKWNGYDDVALLRPAIDTHLSSEFSLSTSNLPAECRQFGGDKIWAQTFNEMMASARQLSLQTFEQWVLAFRGMAAPEWCAKYVEEHDLIDLQSDHAIFRIKTPSVTIRLTVGINQQSEGEIAGDGRALPELNFWQMDVGMEGLSLDHTLSGILGETTNPVLDEYGNDIMEGLEAMRGTAEDYRVSSALDTEYPLATGP